jgi:hypothetical protein
VGRMVRVDLPWYITLTRATDDLHILPNTVMPHIARRLNQDWLREDPVGKQTLPRLLNHPSKGAKILLVTGLAVWGPRGPR